MAGETTEFPFFPKVYDVNYKLAFYRIFSIYLVSYSAHLSFIEINFSAPLFLRLLLYHGK